MAYSSLTQQKQYLRLTDSKDDGLLNDLSARAKELIESHCHRVFEAAQDTTRYLDAVRDVGYGDWTSYGRLPGAAAYGAREEDYEAYRTLWLDKDLCQITSIVNGDGVTVTASQYVTVPRNETPYHAIRLKTSAGVAWTYTDDPEGAIAITGRWAYSITPPADIAHAHVRLVAWLYKQMESYSAALDRPLMSQDGVMLMPMQLPADVKAMLSPYVRR